MKMNVSVQFVVMFGIDMLNTMFKYSSTCEYGDGINYGCQSTAWVAVENFCDCLHIDKLTYMAVIKAVNRHQKHVGKIIFPTNTETFMEALKSHEPEINLD